MMIARLFESVIGGVMADRAATADGAGLRAYGEMVDILWKRGDKSAATCACRKALDHALITAPDKRDPALAKRLDAVAGRVLHRPA